MFHTDISPLMTYVVVQVGGLDIECDVVECQICDSLHVASDSSMA